MTTQKLAQQTGFTLEVSNKRSAGITIKNHEDKAKEKNLRRKEVMTEVFMSIYPTTKR
jgi:hypothetical protein